MKVIVNGENCQTTAATLETLLVELEYYGDWLVTARNEEVVPAHDRADCELADGDRIEILSPMEGG